MQLSTLSEWLSWINAVHPSEICLGLERVKSVAERLNLLNPESIVITVGGTNGKGSTVAGLETIYRAAGFRVGTFTSPYLFKHNEEVRINGIPAPDEAFCQAFEKIEQVRGTTLLTPFEYHTLAALQIFQQQSLDVIILEVGLGGRLDAVNIIDANVAVITSIGIDHVEWLGHTREAIGIEKAGIMRPNKPVICGDPDPPSSLPSQAEKIGATLICQHRDFNYQSVSDHWCWSDGCTTYDCLPVNDLMLQNMSTVLMTVKVLQPQLPVSQQAIEVGLKNTHLPARIQIIPGPITEIYDVAHNPAAVGYLAEKITTFPCTGKTFAIFSMLADKDIASCADQMKKLITAWYIAPLIARRAASTEKIYAALKQSCANAIHSFATITHAYDQARQQAVMGDRLIIFGSFYTVSQVWQHKASHS